MIELNVKTANGIKTFKTDDIGFGVLKQLIKLQENPSDKNFVEAIPRIVKSLFPEITEEEIDNIGMKDLQRILSTKADEILEPVAEVSKN